jgi:hypothetical protein
MAYKREARCPAMSSPLFFSLTPALSPPMDVLMRAVYMLGTVPLYILECVVLLVCSSHTLLNLPLRDVQSEKRSRNSEFSEKKNLHR